MLSKIGYYTQDLVGRSISSDLSLSPLTSFERLCANLYKIFPKKFETSKPYQNFLIVCYEVSLRQFIRMNSLLQYTLVAKAHFKILKLILFPYYSMSDELSTITLHKTKD